MREISLAELLKAGAHFGHQVSRWHPKMRSYIFSARNGIYIIDLEQTKARLEAAADFAEEIAARGGSIVFLGTKRQAKEIIEREARRANMPFIVNRWLGGTFTNFSNVSKLISKLKRLREDRDRGELSKYTKKERLMFEEEIERLDRFVGGISTLSKLPEAVFIVDCRQERTAVRETKKMKVPTIAITDTNVDPTEITYPIPSNDDATKAIDLIVTTIASAIIEGRARFDAAQAAAVAPVTEDAKKTDDAAPTGETVKVINEE